MQPKCLCLGPGMYAHSVLRTSFLSGAILPAVLYCQPHVPRSLHTITELQQNLDEMNQCKKTDHKKYEWAATGPGVRIKL